MIINSIGEVILSEKIDLLVGQYTKKVNLSGYAKGLYFMKITSKNISVNKKLTLQ